MKDDFEMLGFMLILSQSPETLNYLHKLNQHLLGPSFHSYYHRSILLESDFPSLDGNPLPLLRPSYLPCQKMALYSHSRAKTLPGLPVELRLMILEAIVQQKTSRLDILRSCL